MNEKRIYFTLAMWVAFILLLVLSPSWQYGLLIIGYTIMSVSFGVTAQRLGWVQ